MILERGFSPRFHLAFPKCSGHSLYSSSSLVPNTRDYPIGNRSWWPRQSLSDKYRLHHYLKIVNYNLIAIPLPFNLDIDPVHQPRNLGYEARVEFNLEAGDLRYVLQINVQLVLIKTQELINIDYVRIFLQGYLSLESGVYRGHALDMVVVIEGVNDILVIKAQ